MNPQQPSPFFLVPSPFAPMQSPHGHYGSTPANDLPARVRAAMGFLGQLADKSMDRAAVNDMSIEVLPGQKPVGNELVAANAALNLLIDYFGGKLELNHWEKTSDALVRMELVPSGHVIICPVCKEAPMLPSCILCNGGGRVAVHPLAPRES